MCIRDSIITGKRTIGLVGEFGRNEYFKSVEPSSIEEYKICLLYTSDAADERSSVDLGGRRIIKKKNMKKIDGLGDIETKKSTKRISQNSTNKSSTLRIVVY